VAIEPGPPLAEREGVVVGRLLGFFARLRGKWTTPTGEAWQPALAIEAVVDRYRRTGDPALRTVVERSFGRYRGRRSRFHDDDGWYLNAWLRAYEATGDRRYLVEARSLFDGLTAAWDDVCGGGLWWNTDRGYKNAITNGLFMLAAADLHRLAGGGPGGSGTGDHRRWAERAWAWFDSSGMINDADLVNDGLDGRCANNGGTTWTYNQGVLVSALVALYRISADRAYLDRAHRTARAAIGALVHPGGILREPSEPGGDGDAQVFKGVLVRGLADLGCVDPGRAAPYREFVNVNAATVWTAARDRTGGVGLSWPGPVGEVTAATQTAAALLFGAAARLGAAGPHPPS
jgi:predicted alpha-1,6-mannanase (GH76 family)